MISRNSEDGFLVAHWDWLVAGFGALALVAGVVVFVSSGGVDPDEMASSTVHRLMAEKKSETGVVPVDMAPYERDLQFAVKPAVVPEVAESGGNFLVSHARQFCPLCMKPIPADAKEACPACGGKLPEPEKAVVDTDGDGMPDEWERKYGLDPGKDDSNDDLDGDGFTNAEEFAAGTDPSDRNSHPDYFDSLRLELPLKETSLPFYLRTYTKTPSGMKLEFFDPKKRNDYGTLGLAYPVFVGADIGDTGFVAKSFEQKSKKVKIPGSNVERNVDVSIATIVRKSDEKTIEVQVTAGRPKLVPVDVQATLSFSRGEPRQFVVVPGKTVDLRGEKYKVVEIKSVGKGAKVVLEDALLGKIRTIEALEQ